MAIRPLKLPGLQQAQHLLRALGLVWRSSPGWTLANVAVLILRGLLPLAALYLVKLLVDAVAQGAAAPDQGAAWDQVKLLVLLAGGLALLTIALDAVAALVNETQVQVVTDHLLDLLQSRAIAVDLEYYENPDYYNALHRAQQEAPTRPTRLIGSLAQIAQNGISLVGVAGLLISLQPWIALALLAAALPVALVRFRFAGEIYRWQQQRTATERRAEYTNLVLTLPYFAQEVRLFDLGPLFRERFRAIRQQLRQERLRIVSRRALRDLLTQSVAVVPVFVAYGFVSLQALQGVLSVGALVLYYGIFQRGQSYLQATLAGFAGLYEDNLFLASFHEFLTLKPRVQEPGDPVPVPEVIREGITFTDVSFQYPASQRTALRDVSLTIRAGEIVALVGENGSGKTTLVKLLCRLYDPTEGAISIDGVDLRQFATAALRRRLSVVPQDFARYEMTARENIRLGNRELGPDDARIEAAARLAGADALLAKLPRGYDTFLGKWLENGEELSVGEWQKIALARAFVRDAAIIILDEPSSALDARAEHELFERFRQLVRGRTAILISHRLSSVRMADRIFVLDEGRLVESGTHDELMARGGVYADLFARQARHYT